ncbi:MAG: arginine--tRNA ligase [Lachnospiraceae bacterium]|nr:arginine--tRNA ligase [Lachnospiraceae bacterium]
MKKFLDLITEQLQNAFESVGYPTEKITATISNRPDLCEYQCNGAMALAKQVHKAPMEIAEAVVAKLADNPDFELAEAVKPGFINLKVTGAFLADYIRRMEQEDKFGLEAPEKQLKIIVDYGGANVAKPLHIGHLRAAIIGESVKRICKYMGHDVLGDVHLGDWGLQMGQVIAELLLRGKENDFTVTDLEEIYPTASKKCKPESETYDEAFAEEAHRITGELQNGDAQYTKIWQRITDVSKEDLKKNYDNLEVFFELWKGESDVQPYIPDMIQNLKDQGLAYESEGAWVIDVAEESDKKKLPPCIIVKRDGSSLYATTDLATLVEREKLYDPDYIIYVVDKRQALHLEQVFRVSRKAHIVHEGEKLFHLGFGTMNGKDGQPYKTRSGGVMRLESLINEVNDAVLEKMKDNPEISEEEAKATSKIIALAALKYGDLSNQATKDYIFDISRFIEFEGNTGPYILYTIVRIKSILQKANAKTIGPITFTGQPAEKGLMMELSRFSDVMEQSYQELAPHKICSYIYDLANAFNTFYHEVRILSEENEEKKNSYLALLQFTKEVLEQCIDLLGFAAPERM